MTAAATLGQGMDQGMDLTADLPPVGLAALVEEAALLARVDRKYVVPRADLPHLVAALPTGTRVLEIDGRRRFGYASTYLDTPDRESYLGSGRGRRDRWKVRLRDYLDTGGRWLEVKTAGPRGRTVKQRTPAARWDADGEAFVADAVGRPVASALRPVLVTAYDRSTLLLPGSCTRVTLDTDLAWQRPDTGDRLERPGLAIVETKSGATPSAVDRTLWARGHRPVRLSKYGAGAAALDAALPRLKWNDALVRHLGVAPAARRS